ncbi:MAG: hypothetical protein ACE5F9_15195 [Phycisphaerae bacterium]
MSIAVRCPNDTCRRLVRVAASLRGQRIQCPACGAGLRIPEADAQEPVPVSLDDTPPEPSRIASGRGDRESEGRGGEVAERVADTAAGMTSALSPVLKLLLVVVVLGGLAWLGVKVVFPMLWPDEPLATATSGELSRQEDEIRQREAAKKEAESPLNEEAKQKLLATMEAGDLDAARDLLEALQSDVTVPLDDRRALELAFREAVAARVKQIYASVERHVDAGDWDAARERLAAVSKVDESEGRSRAYRENQRRIDAGEALALVEASKAAADRQAFDEARRLVRRALELDRTGKAARAWESELASVMRAGVRFDTSGVAADVYLEEKKVGNTSGTVWRLPSNKRVRLRLQAPGYVPREFREGLSAGRVKTVEIKLVPAVPDAFWVAHLFDAKTLKWLACRVLPDDRPVIAEYARTLETRCLSARRKPKKRKVWQVRMKDGSSHHALEYAALGQTVRFVDLKTGATIRTKTAQIAKAIELDIDEGAKQWLAAAGEEAARADDLCDAFRTFGRFLDVFPDKMAMVLDTAGDQLAVIAKELAGIVACGSSDAGSTRDAMEVGARLEAEIDAWRRAGQDPPAALLEQKRTRH